MTNPDAIPLHLHTLETLTTELLAGRPIPLGETATTGEVVHLDEAARKIFHWYSRNRSVWSKKCSKEDVETLAAAVAGPVPTGTAVTRPPRRDNSRRLHLRKLRAHQFGGLHRFHNGGSSPPPMLELELDSPLVLVQGRNGSGKTSLLSAITWCLTGHVFRSMGDPEDGAQTIELSTDGNDDRRWQMAGVTPLPPKDHLERLPNAHVLIDTWVELTLEDDQGKEYVVTRRLSRAPRTGKIEVTSPQLDALGMDPIAFDVGTRMSGLLPHMRLGTEPSAIGKAIAQLTGLAPLRDLSKHAAKAKEKLLKDLPRDRRAEIEEIDAAYDGDVERLVETYRRQPSIVPADIETPKAFEKDAAKRLEALKAHFGELLTTAFGEAKELLGDTFDASNDGARKSLDRQLPLCKAACRPSGLKKLNCVTRLGGLKKLTDKQLNDASDLIKSLLREAREIIQLEQYPEKARRSRLYAGVGTWLRDNDSQSAVTSCPICATDLTGVTDDVTKRLVSDHLKRHRNTPTTHLSLTLNRWFEDARRRLNDQLPEALRAELNVKDAAHPHRLMTDDLVDELFAEECFSGPTAALKAATIRTADTLKANLPPFNVQTISDVPEQIKATGNDFLRMVESVSAAIAAARWRIEHESECATVFNKLIGREPDPNREAQQHAPEQRTLVDRLLALSAITASAEPATTASNAIEKLRGTLRRRGVVEAKLITYDTASKAIDPILGLGDLVDRQIESLRLHLHTETQMWKDQLYQPAFGNAVSPRLGATRIAPDGVITFQSEASGTRAPAHAIGNASDVRATLVAFLFSFWDYILNRRGGMSLLLLDDFQELFDPDNRRRLANALPKLIERGGRLLVTTNEPSHAGRIGKLKDVTWREVKPVGPGRPVASLPPNETVIDRRRRAFESSSTQDDHEAARSYVACLREWLEGQFADFLAPSSKILVLDPTLATLIDVFRARSNGGMEAIAGPLCRTLAKAADLQPGSATLELLNRSHHTEGDTITYGEVQKQLSQLLHVQKLVTEAHEELERWLLRDEPRSTAKLDESHASMARPCTPRAFSVPVFSDLAAFTSIIIDSATEVEELPLTHEWFKGKGLFRLGCNNFGFSAPKGSLAIVELSDEPIADSRLVIAQLGNRILARRLIYDKNNPRVIGLSSEAENPLERPASMIISTEKVRLYKVVGILFDTNPPLVRIKGDAEAVEASKCLDDIEVAFRVKQDSAQPLAIENQIVLGGKQILLTNVGSWEDRIVAMETSEGHQVLKRIGAEATGLKDVRHFESISGRGSSMIAGIGDIGRDGTKVPTVRSVRPILGVLYV